MKLETISEHGENEKGQLVNNGLETGPVFGVDFYWTWVSQQRSLYTTTGCEIEVDNTASDFVYLLRLLTSLIGSSDEYGLEIQASGTHTGIGCQQ